LRITVYSTIESSENFPIISQTSVITKKTTVPTLETKEIKKEGSGKNKTSISITFASSAKVWKSTIAFRLSQGLGRKHT